MSGFGWTFGEDSQSKDQEQLNEVHVDILDKGCDITSKDTTDSKGSKEFVNLAETRSG